GATTGGQIGFPNGGFTTPSLTITNGTAPAIITVAGADMVPADSATHWTLCVFAGLPACSGPPTIPMNPLPGTDHFSETISSASGLNLGPNAGPGPLQALTNTAADDNLFGPMGNASANQQKNEFLAITGPSQSSDSSTSWTTSVTWTAS